MIVTVGALPWAFDAEESGFGAGDVAALRVGGERVLAGAMAQEASRARAFLDGNAGAHGAIDEHLARAMSAASRVGGQAMTLASAVAREAEPWSAAAGGRGSEAERSEHLRRLHLALDRLDEHLDGVERGLGERHRARAALGARVRTLRSLLSLTALLLVGYLSLVARRDRATADASESLMRERDEFLSMASHELKTPLTTIRLQAQALLRRMRRLIDEGGADFAPLEKSYQQVSAIERQSGRMARLVEDLLDVGRIDAQRFELHCARTDVVELTRQVVREAGALSSRHELRFEHEADAVVAEVDPERVAQVLFNLITNAVKYSPGGGDIAVRVSAAAGRAVRFTVSDHGLGIPSEEQPHLFERFYRARHARASRVSGFGLGLYICREIVRRHGGEMWIESESGVGSSFHFTLPLPPLPAAPPERVDDTGRVLAAGPPRRRLLTPVAAEHYGSPRP